MMSIPSCRTSLSAPVRPDGKGGIWFWISGGGLAHRLSDDTWEIFDDVNSQLLATGVRSLLSDGEGGIWLGTVFGLFHRLSDGTWEIFDTSNSQMPDNDVSSLLSDGEGGIWVGIGTMLGGLSHRLSDGTWEIFDDVNSQLPDNYVNSLLSDGEGGIWVGTILGGLAHRLSDGTWEIFDEVNFQLPDNDVSSLLSDGEGGIWLGTEGGGLAHRLFDGTWEIFDDVNSQLPNNCVSSLLSDGEGGIWVGTLVGLAHRLSDDTWEIFDDVNSQLLATGVRSLLSDGEGGIWLGTVFGLFHRLFEGTWEIFDEVNFQLPYYPYYNYVNSLLSDGEGGIWVGTLVGLAHRLSDGTWEIFDEVNSQLPKNNVSSLLSDGEGGVWVGTWGGGLAHRLSDGTWEIFDSFNSQLPDNYVSSLLSDGEGGIWVGTILGGLVHRLSDGTCKIFDDVNSQLPCNRVSSLLSDGTGGIYIGTDNSGLAHLSFGQKSKLYNEYHDETIIEGTRAAIIIAAGNISPRKNKLWYSIENLTSQIIYSLFYNRGYDHSELYYLSPKSWANFNSDGIGDHIVDAPVTLAQAGEGIEERDLTQDDIQKAFEWAKSKGSLTQPLYLYFVDHGAPGELMLTTVDALKGEALATMIDDYQKATGNQVVVILEACYSGSLIPYLSAPNRVIITSSSEDETSIYDQNGTISFSAAFCMNISGANLKDAFDYTKEIMKYDFGFTDVTPLLDDNGDGVADDLDGEFLANQIGVNGTWGEEDASIAIQPVNGSGMVATGSPMTFEAQTHAVGKIKKVWGVVRSPNPQVEYDDLGTPIMRNPTFNLDDLGGDGVYTGTFNEFTCAGDYTISFFAKDYLNNTAVSSAITITAQGGEACAPIEPNPVGTAATTEVHASQAVYHRGETIEVQVKNNGSGFYDQYTAWAYPDGTLQFLTEENGFVSDILPWASTPRMDNIPVTVIKMPYMFEMPLGTYWAFNLLVPAGTPDILQNLDEWLLTSTSFSVE